MELLVLVFFWLGLCLAVGMFASIRRNRSGIGWFWLAFFISPLLAFFYVAILKEKPDHAQLPASSRAPEPPAAEQPSAALQPTANRPPPPAAEPTDPNQYGRGWKETP